jgi:hypothetical protein
MHFLSEHACETDVFIHVVFHELITFSHRGNKHLYAHFNIYNSI